MRFLPLFLQLASIVSFSCGACLYYGIRRLLYKRGYPVSVFVYTGPCWPHYSDLIAKSPEPERSRLKARKTAMTVCFTLAGACLILSTLFTR